MGIDGLAARSVLLVGVGKRAESGVDACDAAGKVARQLSKRGSVATTLAQASGRNAADAVQAVVEGLILGAYRFDRYKSKKDDPPSLERVTVLGAARWDTKAAKVAVERARIVGESAVWARDLVNTPARDMTPVALAKAAEAMAKEVGLQVEVWDEKRLERGGFGGILGVGQEREPAADDRAPTGAPRPRAPRSR